MATKKLVKLCKTNTYKLNNELILQPSASEVADNYRLKQQTYVKLTNSNQKVKRITTVEYNIDGTPTATTEYNPSSTTNEQWDSYTDNSITEIWSNTYIENLLTDIIDDGEITIKSDTSYYLGNNSDIIGEDTGFLPDSASPTATSYDLQLAVQKYLNNEDISQYGPISTWKFPQVKNLSGLFSNATSLTDISFIQDWDMSKVQNISNMFFGCSNLTSANLSTWDTSNVKEMNAVFTGCSSLQTVNVTDWNLGKLNKNKENNGLEHFFSGCNSLTTITGISNWDVSRVNTLAYTFKDCRSLQSIDLSNWTVSNVKKLTAMFQMSDSGTPAEPKLTSVGDISNWNVFKCESFSSMFVNCSKLSSLNLTTWKMSNALTINAMFKSCTSLTTIGDVSNWKTNQSTFNVAHLFNGCSSLTSVGNLSKWKSNITKVKSLFRMFKDTSSLTSIGNISGWDITNIHSGTFNNLNYMFENSGVTDPGNLSNWNVCLNEPAQTGFATGAAFNTPANADRMPLYPYNIENCPQNF